MDVIKIIHVKDEDKGRFVVFVNDIEAGYIKYEWMENGNFNANGTLVYDEFKGKNIGKQLYNALMNFAREENVEIYPTCPFVVKTMLRDKAVYDLLDDDFKKENDL
ncbi:GNAT family N-acetyltransferase [Chryseobacterium oryctis]|uniref:N-acetyltransferase n=1 Tax=Chryseobacterium oryctis TaxID=2952618 RepID=A0ABT3HRT2_9FLAO|nr:N-acetyltransferase [Chryseobacterium oryctis]MCW3162504.1 N-acetyltransferase [Chryseobacterium oryctis]